MTEVTIDQAFADQFRDAKGYLKLRDPSGHVLGYFLPADKAAVFRGVKSPHSREEIERRYREEAATARPLSDFWSEMKAKYPERFS
jgi:hypothetical protein